MKSMKDRIKEIKDLASKDLPTIKKLAERDKERILNQDLPEIKKLAERDKKEILKNLKKK
jgi:hypothetical protein